jgi:hypothetical protein
MTVLYSESFTGTDANPIGGNWTTITGLAALQRISNCIEGTTGDAGAYIASATPANDQYAKVTMNGTLTTDGGPVVRATGTAVTHYLLDISGTVQIYRVTAGAYAAIGTTYAYSIAAADVWELRAVGTTITGWLNGVQQVSATDANHTSGKFGIFISNTSLRMTAFEGGDFSVGGGKQLTTLGVG